MIPKKPFVCKKIYPKHHVELEKDLMKKRKGTVLSCCEEDDMSVFACVSGPMKLTADLIKWNMVGEVLVPAVNDVGDIEKTDGCARAAALADLF